MTTEVLKSSNLEEFAMTILSMMKICRKFSERVENTVGKLLIVSKEKFAHCEQRKICSLRARTNCSLPAIFPFPTLFSKACTADTYKPGLVWERVKILKIISFPTECLLHRLVDLTLFSNIIVPCHMKMNDRG